MLLLELKKTSGSLGNIHFVGIGGIGMSGVAEIMHNLGYLVQGSDLLTNENTSRLSKIGIKVFSGHHQQNIANASYIVTSSAIEASNPEIIAARVQQVPIIKRSQMLAELTRLKCTIAISGSHGKTTTTALMACLFESAGLSPTVISGGIINSKFTNAYLGSGNYLIAEADESDGTFIEIPAAIVVITNINHEHVDFYQDFNGLLAAFKIFITNIPFYGFAVACLDHPVVKLLIATITERKIITYGLDPAANIQAFNIQAGHQGSSFDVKIDLLGAGQELVIIKQVKIPTPGRHNILNALAALAVGAELNFDLEVMSAGFKEFGGVKRRFSKVCEYNGASIIDDYAHHPVEIIATLSAAKTITQIKGGRVIAIFQPHRYSRVQRLFNDFINCFADADLLYVTEIYSANEKPIDGISGQSLVKSIKDRRTHQHVTYLASESLIAGLIRKHAQPGDLVVMMGAGSISDWANNLSSQLTLADLSMLTFSSLALK